MRDKGRSEGKGERREEQVRKKAVRQDVLRCPRPRYHYYLLLLLLSLLLLLLFS